MGHSQWRPTRYLQMHEKHNVVCNGARRTRERVFPNGNWPRDPRNFTNHAIFSKSAKTGIWERPSRVRLFILGLGSVPAFWGHFILKAWKEVGHFVDWNLLPLTQAFFIAILFRVHHTSVITFALIKCTFQCHTKAAKKDPRKRRPELCSRPENFSSCTSFKE